MFLNTMFLLPLILLAASTAWTANIPKAEFDSCGGDNGYPRGHCRRPEDCHTIQSYLVENTIYRVDAHQCGAFSNPFYGLMVCCPNNVYQKNIEDIRFSGTHLATLRYLKPISLDNYVYRCTGVLLTNTHVLVTKQCIGANVVDKPNRVLLGADDARLYDESQIDARIKSTMNYKNDLALLELKEPLTSDQLSGNISSAKLCEEKDLIGQPTLFAVGYSYDKKNSDSCTKFTQRMQFANRSECRNLKNKLLVQDLDLDQSHFCLTPADQFTSYNDSAECSKCLTYTSSVLHVQRENGTQCVAGIATPTTDECIEGNGPLYFTNIMTDLVSDFFNKIVFGCK